MNIEDVINAKAKGEAQDDKQLQDMLNGNASIESNDMGSTIKTDQGDISLQGRPQEIQLNISRCEFCGHVAEETKPLFTIDNDKFICKPCLILGFRTMLLNNVNMPTIEEMKNEQEIFDAYKY